MIAVFLALTMVSLFISQLSPSVAAPQQDVKAAQVGQLSDIRTSDWFYEYVSVLVTHGVISGYPDGSFRPQRTITRAEFAKVCILAIGERPSTADSTFRDVSNNYWARGYIQRAKEMGFIGGYPDGTFRPLHNVSRQEIAKIVVLSFGHTPAATHKDDFRDVASSLWSWSYVIKAKDLGAISGYPDRTFRPFNFATRAEACKMVAELIDTSKLPTTTSTTARIGTVTTTTTDDAGNTVGSSETPIFSLASIRNFFSQLLFY